MTVGEWADVLRAGAAGVVAAGLTLMGVSGQLLTICMIGALFAVLLSKGESAWTVLAIYIASSAGGAIVAAAAGPLLAAWLIEDSSSVASRAPHLISNLLGMLVPCVLYPALRAVRETVPDVLVAVIRRKAVGRDDGGSQ